MTETGIALGTPAYMSPEQAFGDANIDGRSDVYALGCVVYEMASGRVPSDAPTPQALLAKHAVDKPRSLRTIDQSIPLFVERAVNRAMAKEPGQRFKTPNDLAETLRSQTVLPHTGRQRLAVLPPTNLTNDSEQDFFVQGMHNALISELQKVGIAVIARTSVLQYEHSKKPIHEIALVEVQYALAGVTAWHVWDFAGAEQAFHRAIDINPKHPDVRAYYSHFLFLMQRPDEGMRQMEQAVALDPFHPLIQGLHGMVLFGTGRNAEALAVFQEVLRTVPNHPLALSGLQGVYHAMGMYEEALEATSTFYASLQFSEAEEALALGYEEGGYHEAMRRAADVWAAVSEATYVMPPWEIANLYAMAGEASLALDWLERGFEEKDPSMPYLHVLPTLRDLQEEPRFLDLVRRMGLPID